MRLLAPLCSVDCLASWQRVSCPLLFADVYFEYSDWCCQLGKNNFCHTLQANQHLSHLVRVSQGNVTFQLSINLQIQMPKPWPSQDWQTVLCFHVWVCNRWCSHWSIQAASSSRWPKWCAHTIFWRSFVAFTPLHSTKTIQVLIDGAVALRHFGMLY